MTAGKNTAFLLHFLNYVFVITPFYSQRVWQSVQRSGHKFFRHLAEKSNRESVGSPNGSGRNRNRFLVYCKKCKYMHTQACFVRVYIP